MNFGYVKFSTFAPEIKVADVDFNANSIINAIRLASEKGAKFLVLPELCITGCTAGDLFNQNILLNNALYGLKKITKATQDKGVIVSVGLPLRVDGLVYNVCAILFEGEILGVVPKLSLSLLEQRNFSCADYQGYVKIDDVNVPFGKDLIFKNKQNSSFKFGVAFYEELASGYDFGGEIVKNGARLIVCPCAEYEYSNASNDRLNTVLAFSKKYACGVALSNCGYGESTTDGVYSGQGAVVENGQTLALNKPFDQEMIFADIDLEFLDFERNNKYKNLGINDQSHQIDFDLELSDDTDRVYKKYPFINLGEEELLIRIQAEGLKKRILHTYANTLIVGLSGGLDSTLALIVAVKAMELAGKSSKDVIAVTMPCFGTSSRTFDNSVKLAKAFNVTLKKVEIAKSVKRHLKDIEHPENVQDAAYENAQARERTQVLMDMANMYNGLVVGTGDLSELALGFATYNGDHMSMYAVNASLPKTLIRHLTTFVAQNSKTKKRTVLLDIVDTPVSPELLPAKDDKIQQVTEDIVGPYVLHDFFLYCMVKRGFSPKKIFKVAVNTFKGEFDGQTILKWLKTFTRRFFTQQFKRSCLPDGVKVTEISLSPRGGLVMPSDAVSKLWLEELENINI